MSSVTDLRTQTLSVIKAGLVSVVLTVLGLGGANLHRRLAKIEGAATVPVGCACVCGEVAK